MHLSWRGVNVLLVTTSTVLFATEGHLLAFTPLQLQEMGLRRRRDRRLDGHPGRRDDGDGAAARSALGRARRALLAPRDPAADFHCAGALAAAGGLGDLICRGWWLPGRLLG